MPNTDDTSSYLQRPLRPIHTALWETARDRGRIALKTWGRTIFVNVILPNDDGPLWLNDHRLLVGAALDAVDAGAGYRFTILLAPEGPVALDLRQMGEQLGAHLPHVEPGDA